MPNTDLGAGVHGRNPHAWLSLSASSRTGENERLGDTLALLGTAHKLVPVWLLFHDLRSRLGLLDDLLR